MLILLVWGLRAQLSHQLRVLRLLVTTRRSSRHWCLAGLFRAGEQRWDGVGKGEASLVSISSH